MPESPTAAGGPSGVVATLKATPRRTAVGALLLVASLAGAHLVERRGVDRYVSLDRGAATVVTVPADLVDPAHEGALVHVRGAAQSGVELVDEAFGVKLQALRLVRHVEIYAWEESKRDDKRKNEKGEDETVTTYVYTKRFTEKPADSSSFKEADTHKNPEKSAFAEQELVAKDSRLGAFVLPSDALRKLTKFEPAKVTQEMLSRSPHAAQLHEHEGAAFYGKDPKDPRVGDLRISYQIVKPQTVSLVARQSGGTFVAYQPNPEADEVVFLLASGDVEAKAMFAVAKEDTSRLTLGLRGLTALAAIVALSLLLVPFASRRPFVPRFTRAPRVSAVLISGLLGVGAVVGVGGGTWVAMRPLVGVPALLAAVGCFALAGVAERRSRKA
ncbi:MAG: TMEM43 family protein [Myxococcales bacterium]|jgi:hypothetical protein|nr:TMEM43 family protein [Myxococcales bacterium]MBL0193148.1 TMEM43 family protein [Myxococcales bacterium]HQY60977.1 TMEM43 family protein [Polyangiaceae bacterium]